MRIIVKHRELGIHGSITHFFTQVIKKLPEKPSLTGEKDETLLTLAIVCWEDPDRSIQIATLDQLTWVNIEGELDQLAGIIDEENEEDEEDEEITV